VRRMGGSGLAWQMSYGAGERHPTPEGRPGTGQAWPWSRRLGSRVVVPVERFLRKQKAQRLWRETSYEKVDTR
jgi:hypothetical protein